MGMISRVRGRIRSDSFSKIHSMKSEEKLANIVWLFSLVSILPVWPPRGVAAALGGAWALYAALLLPALVAVNYKYPARWYPAVLRAAHGAARLLRPPLRRLLAVLRAAYAPVQRAETLFTYTLSNTQSHPGAARLLRPPLRRLLAVLRAAYAPVQRAETLFLEMNNISTMVGQLMLFTACDRLLLSPGGVTSLYSLMFYNVMTYSVSYVRELCLKTDWSPYVNVTRHSQVKHLAMSATKIVLEWTKAVTFVVTVTFVLLALGLEQGLENYKPTVLYTVVTGAYYLATERTFVELWPGALAALRLERLEGMEALHCGAWGGAGALALAAPLGPALAWRGRWRLAALLLYVCVWLQGARVREARARLAAARGVLAPFRRAAPDEMRRLEDVCAVCLGGMRAARVTPCAHYFHADCLRRCLAASDRCPICVRPYTFC